MNYQQTEIAGDSWIRANRIIIENPYEGTPAATFMEERIINLPDNVITQSQGCIVEPFLSENFEKTFPLLHPQTGESVGLASYQDVYILLSSLYLSIAKQRDEKNV